MTPIAETIEIGNDPVPLSLPPRYFNLMLDQTNLVKNYLLKIPTVSEKIQNKYAPDGYGGAKEKNIIGWYLIGESVAKQAFKDGETILELDKNWWWGFSMEGKVYQQFIDDYTVINLS